MPILTLNNMNQVHIMVIFLQLFTLSIMDEGLKIQFINIIIICFVCGVGFFFSGGK